MNEISIKAVLVHDIGNVEIFNINVNEDKYIIVKKRLEYEYKRIVVILNNQKAYGHIKSVAIPKNKKIQKELNELVSAKKIINESLNKLKVFYAR